MLPAAAIAAAGTCWGVETLSAGRGALQLAVVAAVLLVAGLLVFRRRDLD
ncbi:hypothetical protein HGA09_18565, partial [Cellulomonas hominis]|nr:hypothetical protein [Cellulomonas hominis]